LLYVTLLRSLPLRRPPLRMAPGWVMAMLLIAPMDPETLDLVDRQPGVVCQFWQGLILAPPHVSISSAVFVVGAN